MPLFGPSIAVGDYDNERPPRPLCGYSPPPGIITDFHNNGDGTFSDVTEKAGVAGPGAKRFGRLRGF